MKTENITSKERDVEIKKLELEIAQLRLELSQKERQKEVLEEKKETKSLGIDRRERQIFAGDTVELLTSSQRGPFRGVKYAIALGLSKRHIGRVIIGKIGDSDATTNRESHNLLVVARKNESRFTNTINSAKQWWK